MKQNHPLSDSTVLDFCRAHLSSQEMALLSRLSLFHGPADEDVIHAVFLRSDTPTVSGELAGLDSEALRMLLVRLEEVGLVEQVDDRRWTAHAVVRQFFPPLVAEPALMHIAVADSLSRRPESSRAPSPVALDVLEEALCQALDADASPLALSLYQERMHGASWMVNLGEVVRAERVVRRLLERVNDDPSLHEDLGCILERQGRLVEAARQYLRALRRGQPADEVRLLLRLARNTAQRGRLPQAERLARRACDRCAETGVVDIAEAASLILAWIEHLRKGQGRIPRVEERSASLTLLVVAMLIQRGAVGQARRLSWGVSSGGGENTTVGHEVQLARIFADFEMQLRESTRPPAEIAAATLDALPLHRALDFFRRSGQRVVLTQGLLFTARLRRLAGDTSGALNDLETAQALARECGLRLHTIDVLLEGRHVGGEATPVRLALELAMRPSIQYGWGAVEATLWLALSDLGVDIEARLADAKDHIEADVQRGAGLPDLPISEETLSELLRAEETQETFLGGGELTQEVTVRGPSGLAMRVPVERPFARQVEALTEAFDAAAATGMWNLYYESQLRDRDHPGPTYHLGVLCAMLGFDRLASAIADDLARCRPPVPGAACLLAACASTVESALSILRNASDPARSLYYNLGLVCEHEGHVEEARRAYERALRVDWTYAAARARLRALDGCEAREKCRRTLKQLMHAATTCPVRSTRFPTDLQELVPSLLGSVPVCAEGATPYRVYRSTHGDRLLLACRRHALRLDSRRGDLTPRPPVAPLEPPEAAFLHRMRDLRPYMGVGRLFVTTSRPARIVEQGDPGGLPTPVWQAIDVGH